MQTQTQRQRPKREPASQPGEDRAGARTSPETLWLASDPLPASASASGPEGDDVQVLRLHRGEEVDVGVSMTAHELRSPMIAVRAALESVALAGGLPEPSMRLLVRSIEQLRRLSDLIDGLLMYAAGGTVVRPRPAAVVQALHEAVVACGTELASSDRVVVDGPDDAVALLDPALFRGAIVNLMTNALMYSPADAPVEVTVQHGDGSVIVCVRDSGAGIPPHEREVIFEAFTRGDDARQHPGTGLGLFITRLIVEAHGGRVWVESGPPSAPGAAFWIELPAVEQERLTACAS